MKTQITLGLLLVTEVLLALYGWQTDSSSLWVIVPSIFLPGTLLLFCATAFRLNSEGKLRRDTIIFKILAGLNPNEANAGKFQVCPNFWLTAVMMAILLFVAAVFWRGGCRVVSIFINPDQFRSVAYILFGFMGIVGYVAFALGTLDYINSKRSARHWGSLDVEFLAMLPTTLFFLMWPSSALVDQGKYPTLFPSFLHYMALDFFLAFGSAGFIFCFVTVVAIIWTLVENVCRAVKKSAFPKIVSFVNNQCPILEVEPEKKVVQTPEKPPEVDLFI